MAARRSASASPGVAAAIAYAEAVVAARVPAGRLARLACGRFLRDKAAADSGAGPWGFDPDLVEAALLFAGEMPNIKGPEAGRPLRLAPWQKLVFANLFGFVERGTTTRRFRQGVVFVPRGNGKTTLAAPIALYLTFVEGEGGAEGYAAAVTRDQARILFEAARAMVRRSPGFRAAFGVGVGANAIHQEGTASRFAPVSSDAKALDGLNVQVAVCDEIASHKTSEVYDVLLTAMGKRKHPLLLSISTATGNNAGIGKQLWDYAARVLDGAQEDDRLFALIYAADDADDPWDEATWIKANPSWGQAVQPDAVRAIMRQARNNPAQEAAARTRHLNLWIGADEALFSMRAWRAGADPALSLDDLEGQECHLAIDLASKTDLAALALVFPRKDDDTGRIEYTAFARCYLNEAAVMEARNPSYPGWAADGHLTVTPGNETDFAVVEADVLDLCRRFRVLSVAYDPWQCTQMSQNLRAGGVPAVEFGATTRNFSEPTKELDAAMRSGRVRHDGNPVLEWCLGNVVGRYDARANVYPKRGRPEQKIDAAVALIMGIARAMAAAEVEPGYQMLFVG
jgi:phage terminase large subunit-like protein